MAAYIVRRLLLMIPTLLGIMVLNFVIIQAAPGGPVEQIIAQLQGKSVSATARFSGGGGEVGGGAAAAAQPGTRQSKYRGAQGHRSRSSSRTSSASSASTSRRTSASC